MAATSGTSVLPNTAPRTLRNYVGGTWLELEAAVLEDHDPATGRTLARVPMSGYAEVDAAVEAARDAAGAWGTTSPLVRGRALMRLREVLDARKDELADIVTLDMGKTWSDAAAEVQRGIESVEAACAVPTLLKGENLVGVASGVDVELIRQPVGVVAAITPFNFPAMIPLWFLPFAIGCGNAFILKPSEQDPLAAELIVELIDAIDEIPEGLVNLVHGGRDAVNALLDHPGVDAISFVGSAVTARHVYRRASDRGKRVQALGGAKNAMVVMPDANERAMTAGVMSSAFGAAGQRCLAGSIAILVGTREEQDLARDRIVAAAAELRTGDGAQPTTDVCPLVSPSARDRVAEEIELAVDDGATVILDGRAERGPGGCELGPTILDDVDLESRAATEELFGPVLALRRVPDLDAAIEAVNAGRYGNASVVFTTSGHAAREFRTRVQAGMVGVNVGVAAPIAWFPFSGWKDSFDGDLHANGTDAVRFYTRAKVVTSRWS
jgi:malonate-semialdehyde dehydrogenase (acetylating)/methylmalonate-semialdehyde dehydrogenase